MPCDYPQLMWRTEAKHPSGKNIMTFNPLKAMNSASPIEIPCGRCMGCRLDKARQWGLRCLHEARMHPENCFVTLTLDPKFMPADYSLDIFHPLERELELVEKLKAAGIGIPSAGRIAPTLEQIERLKAVRQKLKSGNERLTADLREQLKAEGLIGDAAQTGLFQKFIQDLRNECRLNHDGKTIRFFGAGEYGDKGLRPHIHILVFNHDFADRKFFKNNDQGQPLYTSETLDRLWSTPDGERLGFATLGDVTLDSAQYVARYCTKKINGDLAEKHYQRISPIDGKPYQVRPEFCLMSRMPGIGRGWYDKWHQDLWWGYTVHDGTKMPIPKYYKGLMSEEDKKRLKKWAWKASFAKKPDRTKARRAVIAEVRRLKMARYKRDSEL